MNWDNGIRQYIGYAISALESLVHIEVEKRWVSGKVVPDEDTPVEQ
jgi:hypothetical protein